MHPGNEPASSSIKKGVIFFLSLAGAIFLAERMGFSEFGMSVVALATLVGVGLYITD